MVCGTRVYRVLIGYHFLKLHSEKACQKSKAQLDFLIKPSTGLL